MRIIFSSNGWEDYQYWVGNDSKVLVRLNGLIEECRRHPHTGKGKPEPLKGDLKGWWSRRITEKNRLVYRAAGQGADQSLQIAQCRYHY